MHCILHGSYAPEAKALPRGVTSNNWYFRCNTGKYLQEVPKLLTISNCTFRQIVPGVVYQLFDSWIWGPLICDLWIFSHQTCVSASIMHLCALSMDRYFSIKSPYRYLAIRTLKMMTIYLAVIFLTAFSVSVPPLINGNIHADDGHSQICLIYQNPIYHVYAVFVGFFIPFSITIFIYLVMHRAVRQIKRKSKLHKIRFKTTPCNSNKVEPDPATIVSLLPIFVERKHMKNSVISTKQQLY